MARNDRRLGVGRPMQPLHRAEGKRLWADSSSKRSAEELAALHEIILAANSSLSPDMVIDTILERIISLLGPDLAMIFVRDGDEFHLKGLKAADPGPYENLDIVHRTGECLCGIAVQKGQAVFSLDIHNDPRCTWSECREAGLQSMAALPMISDGAVIGLLCLASRSKTDFESHHVFLEIMANQASLSLKNAFLHQQVQDRNIQLLEQLENIQAAEISKQRESVFRTAIIDKAVEGLCVLYGIEEFPYQRFVVWNNRMIEITGYTQDEVNRDGWMPPEHPDPEEQRRLQGRLSALREGREIPDEEWEIIRKDGQKRIVRVNASTIKNGGEPHRVLVLMDDITEMRRAFEDIRRERDLFEKITLTSPAGIVLVDRNGGITYANRQAEAVLGLTREKITNRCYNSPDWKITDLEGRPLPDDELPFIKVRKSGKPVYGLEHAIEWPDGRRVPLAVNALALYDADGRFDGMLATLENITDRREAEEALRESEEKYRMLFESSTDGIFLIKDVVVDCNEAAARILKSKKTDIIGRNPADFFPGEQENGSAPISTGHAQWEAVNAGQPKLFNWRFRTPDDEIVELEVSLESVNWNGDKALLATGRDITERNRMVRQVQYEKERFRVLSDASPIGIALLGKDGDFRYLNPKFQEICEYKVEDIPTLEEWHEKVYPDPEYRKQVRRIWEEDKASIQPGGSIVRVFQITTRSGDAKMIQFRMAKLTRERLLVLFEDITARHKSEEEKQRLQGQLLQARKMEAIGTLAGGIAHDFNNILMGIAGHASLMEMDLTAGDPHMDSLRNIQGLVRGASELTRQLLGFARGGKYQTRSTDINRLVQNTADMFGRTIKELSIQTDFQEDAWPVEVDQNQIEQVLMNLFVNAWQAMPGGGTLYLGTSNVELDEIYAAANDSNPGRYIKISITDTGSGMDEATRQRIFEPFFTTKEMGRGTGLGLASAYGIIKNHNGIISVYSELGRGTTFHIYLPVTERAETGESAEFQPKSASGAETILLVDDEDYILDVGAKMLSRLGYEVLTAQNGEEALKIFREKGQDIDLVILDMIMPRMGGGKTFDRLREISPRVKVLLASGYSVNGEATEILNRGCDGFIQKPFQLGTLSSVISEIISRGSSKGGSD